jgi:nucleoid-associated protein YgaU
MLNKRDEYNQDEYNDYYRQETQGAEISEEGDEEGGMGNKLIVLLLLLALGIAGYFGYKAMDSSSEDNSIDTSLQVTAESSLPQSVQEEPDVEEPMVEKAVEEEVVIQEENNPEETKVKVIEVKHEEPKVANIQESVTKEVTKAVSSAGKMSADEVASIVAAVMQQMSQKSTKSTAPVPVKQDAELMNTLSNTEVDSVSADLEKALNNVDVNENTHIDNTKKKIDVYNKVNVQNTKGTDILSQLSEQINQEINDNPKISSTTTTTNEEDKDYSTEIKKEVVFREKEMRIIVVKKGDTLGKLAKRAYGNVMEYKRIYKANPEITRPDRIYIGQKIRIPLD